MTQRFTTRRFTSLTRQERETLIDTKEARSRERLARELKAFGPDPNGDTPSCFRQKRGRPAIPVVRAPPGGPAPRNLWERSNLNG
jgi:hypothetical protein